MKNNREEIKAFATYLKDLQYSKNSIDDYTRYVNRFLEWLKEENLNPESCRYSDFLGFIKKCKALNYSIPNLNGHIRGVKYFYEHLKKEGKASHNPASTLHLKGTTRRLPHDILSKEFLEELCQVYKASTPVQKRNKIMLSLLVNQALRREELERLEPQEINLYKGTIYIKGTAKTKSRTLKLAADQILPLQEYMNTVRPELVKMTLNPTERLFITLGTSTKIKDVAREFLRELKKKHPQLKSFIQIRTSVITHWLKEKNIRQVQYLAGHGHIISTEPYKKVTLKNLHEALNKYHPMK